MEPFPTCRSDERPTKMEKIHPATLKPEAVRTPPTPRWEGMDRLDDVKSRSKWFDSESRDVMSDKFLWGPQNYYSSSERNDWNWPGPWCLSRPTSNIRVVDSTWLSSVPSNLAWTMTHVWWAQGLEGTPTLTCQTWGSHDAPGPQTNWPCPNF